MIASGFVREVISKFEGLFENRLSNMAEAWRDYLIQQKAKSMNEKSRRKFLSQFSRKIRVVATSSGQIVEHERDIMTHEFPEGEPVLSPEALLDFEAAVTVSISPEVLKRSWGKIKHRLAFHVINSALEFETGSEVFDAMWKIGIITHEDLTGHYCRGEIGRERMLPFKS